MFSSSLSYAYVHLVSSLIVLFRSYNLWLAWFYQLWKMVCQSPTEEVDLFISPGVLSVLLYYFEAVLLDLNHRIILSFWSVYHCAVILFYFYGYFSF